MKVLIKKEDGSYEWSGETKIQVFLMLIFVLAAQLIANRLIRWFNSEGMRETFVQNKRYAIDNAVISLKQMVKFLDSFDDILDLTMNGENNRWDVLRSAANGVIQLCALYQNRKDADPVNSGKTGTAIRNAIKQLSADRTYNIEEVLKYYE